MNILLLAAAILFWLVAAFPGFIQIGVDRVEWGWLGLTAFGLWVLLSGGDVTALFRRRPPPT